ncbi:MAG: hypothetical protein AAGJ83_05630, partial [Planctomycetota bacterium]
LVVSTAVIGFLALPADTPIQPPAIPDATDRELVSESVQVSQTSARMKSARHEREDLQDRQSWIDSWLTDDPDPIHAEAKLREVAASVDVQLIDLELQHSGSRDGIGIHAFDLELIGSMEAIDRFIRTVDGGNNSLRCDRIRLKTEDEKPGVAALTVVSAFRVND